MPRTVSQSDTKFSSKHSPWRWRCVSVAGITGVALAAMLHPTISNAQGMEGSNEALVRVLFEEVLNEGDTSGLPGLMIEDYVQHNPFVPQGREGFVQGLSAFRAAFPDYRSTIDQIAMDGDRVWVLHTARGTQCAEYFGVPAAGRAFEVQVVDIFRIEDGRLAEHWDVFPAERMVAQLTDTDAPADPARCDALE